jgi:hypothetical protein
LGLKSTWIRGPQNTLSKLNLAERDHWSIQQRLFDEKGTLAPR